MNGILRRLALLSRRTFVPAVVALVMIGFGASSASAERDSAASIVGLWQIAFSYGGSVFDNVFSGWTSDGLEFDQHTDSPILTGYVCYGTWIKLKDHTYANTHPFFDYDSKTGIWAGTSGYLNYVVTVSDDGKTFTGKENGTDGVPGPNPYATGGKPFSGVTPSATKIEVDKSLLP